jgi:hypothetical protein
MKWENVVLSAKLETQFNKDLYLEQTFFYSGYRNNLDIQQVAVNSVIQSSIEDIGYKNLFRYQIKNIPFESGIQYAYHNLRPLRYETSNANLRHDEEGLGRNGAHDFSAFVTSNFKITSRITLEPGLRYNFYSNYSYIKDKRSNFNSLDFRLLGRYRLGRANYLRVGCGNNNQHINKLPISSVGLPADSWISSSDVVLPQKGMEVSLGYYHSINNDAFEFSSDVYYKRMSGVVEYYTELIRDKEMDFLENAYWGDGQAYGIEFMVKKNLGKFTGWLSYTLGRSERWFDEIDEGRKFLARYDRTHDLSFVGSYVFNSKWDVSLVCVYASGNRYTQPSSWYFINNTPVREYGKHNGARLPYYSRVDVSINYWFREDNGINVSVYNLLMAKNPIFIAMTIFGDENNNLRLSMMRQWLFTIMPSISWRFKF